MSELRCGAPALISETLSGPKVLCAALCGVLCALVRAFEAPRAPPAGQPCAIFVQWPRANAEVKAFWPGLQSRYAFVSEWGCYWRVSDLAIPK